MSLKSSFKKTNLDLTKPPGPNRTNSKNVGSGRYITPKTWNTYGWSFQDQFPGGALKDLDGKLVFTTLHQWTPNKTYINSFRGKGFTPPPLPAPTPPPTAPPPAPTAPPPIPNFPTI